MLEVELRIQLKSYLERLVQPIELVASLDQSEASRELGELLEEIASLSDKISVNREGDDERRPSFAIRRIGSDISVIFAGIPLGHEFTSLVLALLQVSGYPPKVEQDVLDQIRALDGDY